MLYLVWYDADIRRPVVDRLQDARTAYSRRFSTAPNLVLVSADETVELEGVDVRSVRTVQPHHFWVGHNDETDLTQGGEEGKLLHG